MENMYLWLKKSETTILMGIKWELCWFSSSIEYKDKWDTYFNSYI